MKRYWYFEACGFVSEPFEADSLEEAVAYVMENFRNPEDPDFDHDDGGLIAEVDGWWECVATFTGDTTHNPDNERRLADAIDALTGPNPPTPGAP